jgi:16S rRNA (cytosine967-C5)-methyltransferase
MSFFTDHLDRIVDQYEGLPPLPAFLRGYYKLYPKLGSRDRKALSEAAFIYCRCKSFYRNEKTMDVIAKGYLLCKSENQFLKKMLGEHLSQLGESIPEPAAPQGFSIPLSSGISNEEWLHSLWKQPQVFIRVRKDMEQVQALLKDNDITYEVIAVDGNDKQDCLMIPNGTAIDKILPEDAYVVQDLSSQASVYQLMAHIGKPAQQVWDVCAGAGGKSILLKDKLPDFHLLATDIRDTILHNLRARFKLYGLYKVKTAVVDSADPLALQGKIGEHTFDLVLCDVPCSGSGTWARTPEQFHFFKPNDLKKFEELQYPIASNAAKYVASGGTMAYITCSVFKQENEDVVAKLVQQDGLELLHQQIINGVDQQADCMFVSFFRKN